MSFIAERISYRRGRVNLSFGGLLYATTGEIIGSASLRGLYLSGFYGRGEGNEERNGGTCSVVQLDVGLEGGKSYARDDSLERCVEMLLANIGGICDLGKFWVRDLAFILKMQGVCVVLLGILCSKSKRLLKS